ncbi:hypothetical protein Tco_1067585 [Tanacetum coccineum]|uniref:Retrovirus-related Pol polyprotein from transposon TNT 1-94-like beta-barrel domain-containing protein n=1 Tax=Tanacetum coccineum TaxID=301880 RepID=A0ABQ5HFD3_9ASTR
MIKSSQTSQEAPDFNSFFKIKNLKHQIQEKDNVIRDLKVLVSNVNDRSCEPYNDKDVTDLLEQNESLRADIEKIEDLKAYNEICVVNILNSVNATPTVKIVLNKGKQTWKPKGKLSENSLNKTKQVVQVILWYLDSGCSKHMMGNRSKLKNFVEKFIGIVRFVNDHFGDIMGYEDYVISDMPPERFLALLRDINGVTFLKASSFKTFNFGTNPMIRARKDLVRGLPRLKFEKDHLCSVCQLRKSEKFSHKSKSKNTNMEVLHTPSHGSVVVNERPEPIIMTPGQLKSGLAPTDKELEMLFQPMFDEYVEQSRVNEPVPSATAVNAQVVPPGTSLYTTYCQDARLKVLHRQHEICIIQSTLSETQPRLLKPPELSPEASGPNDSPS